MLGRLIQALIFLSSQSSESDKSYKKRVRQKAEREGVRPPASILLSFRTRTEVFFDDLLKVIKVIERSKMNSLRCLFMENDVNTVGETWRKIGFDIIT